MQMFQFEFQFERHAGNKMIWKLFSIAETQKTCNLVRICYHGLLSTFYEYSGKYQLVLVTAMIVFLSNDQLKEILW